MEPTREQPGVRPYRSHKLPACSACRHRKGRCHVDDPALPCRFCRQRGIACDHGLLGAKSPSTQRKSPANRRLPRANGSSSGSGSAARVPTNNASSLAQMSFDEMNTPSESSPIMIDPTMAEDLDVLENHLASRQELEKPQTQPYVRISNSLGESIVYRTVPRLRKGLQSTSNPGLVQREILENVLGSLGIDVIKLYFDMVNPHFPILDEASFWKLWKKDPMRISSTLMCDIYAVALQYWDCSERLRTHTRPDLQFVWNQAVLSLRDDFMAPSLTTVHATLLDLLGRPIYQITANIINAGRSVSVARSRGLHRDPTTWRASSAEKSLRTRVWWAVLIHDHWASLSHGTPPNVASESYDVPLPEPSSFVSNNAPVSHQRAAASFHHFCRLTSVLGDILPLIHSLKPNYKEAWKSIRRTECALDEWEDALPDYLGFDIHGDTPGTRKPWSSGLWFYYLTLKLMLNRLAFRICFRDQDQAQQELKHFRFAELYRSATAVVDYVISLQSEQYHEFWLPYTSYLLVSATTTLLRCTVETSNVEDKKKSSAQLSTLLSALKVAHEQHDWDLAELCIETCRNSIESIAAANQTTAAVQPVVAATPTIGVPHEGVVSDAQPGIQQADVETQILGEDVNFPFSLDIPWDHFWDDMAEPWHMLDQY